MWRRPDGYRRAARIGRQAAVAVHPGVCALQHPAVSPQAGTALDPSPCDTRDDAAGTALPTTAAVIISLVGMQLPGPAARTATPAGANTPRCRDPAAVVGPCHRPHDTMPAWAVLPRHPPGRIAKSFERKAAANSAWYRKQRPTFSDTLAAVRRHIWREQGFLTSRPSSHRAKPRRALQLAWAYALCHAA